MIIYYFKKNTIICEYSALKVLKSALFDACGRNVWRASARGFFFGYSFGAASILRRGGESEEETASFQTEAVLSLR